MQTRNMNYAFNVEYFEEILTNNTSAEFLNKQLLEVANSKSIKSIINYGNLMVNELRKLGCVQHSVRILYPGVIIGSGYPHIIGKATGEIQIGFTFDYTTGAPYYPGSSVKGVIRNIFNHAIADIEYQKYINSYLRENNKAMFMPDDFASYVSECFEGTEIPMMNRDIFYDAFVVGVYKNPDNINTSKKIIGLDNLCPHGDDLLVEPVPITLIKILPDVCFTFNFKLMDFNYGNFILTAHDKIGLYMRIIKDFGFGAKTNVGYGATLSVKEEEVIREIADTATENKINSHICKTPGCNITCGFNKRENKYYDYCNACTNKRNR